MLYREAGQFKTSYASDQAIFPILQDRIGIAIILAIAYVVIPLTHNDFLINAVMGSAHLALTWTLAALVTLHLAGVAKHVLVNRDGLLACMGIGAKASAPPAG